MGIHIASTPSNSSCSQGESQCCLGKVSRRNAVNDAPTKPTNHPVPMNRTNTPVRANAPTISGPQQAQIQKLVVETGTELQRLLAHFGIERLQDLPGSEFIRVLRSLESRRAA